MRILLILPYFEPYNNPRALRWSAIVREWLQQGVQVDVLCGKHAGLQPQTSHSNLNIIAPAYPSPAARQWRANRSKSARLVLLKKLYRFLVKSWQWPDDSRFWWSRSVQPARKLLAENEYDAVISVSLPFSSHGLAMQLIRNHKKLPWIVDIGDPFSLQPLHPVNNQLLFRGRNRRAEAAIFRQASRIVLTNLGCRNLYQKAFPDIPSDRFTVIGPLSALEVAASKPTHNEQLCLGHFGRFAAGIRDPDPFIPILRVFCQAGAQFQFYGDTSGLLDKQLKKATDLQGSIHTYPLVAYSNLPERIQEQDALLLFGNKTDFQLPSKIADYIKSGLPILYIAQLGTEDPVRELLKGHPFVVYLDLLSDSNAIQKAYETLTKWRGERARTQNWKALTKQVDAGTIARKYLDVIRSCFEE